MKKLLILLVAIVSYNQVNAQGIEFEQLSLNKTIEKAKKEDKLVFIDCYTQWCGPCKMLAKKVFVLDNVGKYFNKNFVSIKMDMETEEGRKVAQKYQVKFYPTLLWLDQNGKIVHRVSGAGDNKYLLAEAEKAVNPESRWSHMEQRYKDGERDHAFLRKFIMDGVRAGFDVKNVVEEYLQLKEEKEYINKEDFYIIANNIFSKDHPKFRLVFDNKEKYKELVGARYVSMFINECLVKELLPLTSTDSIERFEQKKEEIKDLDPELGEQIAQLARLRVLKMKTRIGGGKKEFVLSYFKAYMEYVDKHQSNNATELGQCAWETSNSKFILSKEILHSAIEMIKKSIDLDPQYYSYDTYARLLEKNGFHEDALRQAKIAIELAPVKQKERLWSYVYINK